MMFPSDEIWPGPLAFTMTDLPVERLVTCTTRRPVTICAPVENVVVYSLLISGVTPTSKFGQNGPENAVAGAKVRVGGSAAAALASASASAVTATRVARADLRIVPPFGPPLPRRSQRCLTAPT